MNVKKLKRTSAARAGGLQPALFASPGASGAHWAQGGGPPKVMLTLHQPGAVHQSLLLKGASALERSLTGQAVVSTTAGLPKGMLTFQQAAPGRRCFSYHYPFISRT